MPTMLVLLMTDEEHHDGGDLQRQALHSECYDDGLVSMILVPVI